MGRCAITSGRGDDLRDGYVRSGPPIAPIAQDRLPAIESWLKITRDSATVSDFGRMRWQCVEAPLGTSTGSGIMNLTRWRSIIERAPRLDRLDHDDRYRFLAWLILLMDDLDDAPIPRLAKWLYKMGVADPDRVKSHWADQLSGLTEVPQDFHPGRITMVRDLWEELKTVECEARDASRKSRFSDSPG